MAQSGDSDWLVDSDDPSDTGPSSSEDEPDWQPSTDSSDVEIVATESNSVDAEAACVVCHSDANPALMLVCDECNDLYHLKCAGEKSVPKQDIWNCPPCAAIRRAQVSSALRGVSGLNGLRTTATAARAVTQAATLKQTVKAADHAQQKRLAAAHMAMAAAAKAAADDDSTMQLGTSKRPVGRPPMTAEQRNAKQAHRLASSAANPSAVIAASVTIARKTADINADMFDAVITWARTQVAGGMAMERGGTYGHLHIQGVVKAYGPTPQLVNRAIKAALGSLLTKDMVVCVRKLTGRALHTWHGLIGYIHKDSHLPHFRVQLHNITEADVAVGREEYLKYGAGSLKKKTSLTPRNIFAKAMLFTEMHLHNTPMGQLTFPQTLVEMLHTGKYYPEGFVLPCGGRGLSHERAGAQWRLQTAPETAQPEDIQRVFFAEGDMPQYPAGGRYYNAEAPDLRLQRMVDMYFTPIAERDDTAAAGQPAVLRTAASPRRGAVFAGFDDGGLGDVLGHSSGYREAVVAADNLEYWQTIQAKMSSLQEQPGSSARAQEIGEGLNVLAGLLADDDEDDMFVIDRDGDVQRMQA